MSVEFGPLWPTIGWIFGIAVAYKIVFSQWQIFRAKRFLQLYENYVLDQVAGKGGWKLIEHKTEIIRLLRATGISEPFIGYQELMGFGQLRQGDVSVWENLDSLSDDRIMPIIVGNFHQAIGYFRARRNESLSPFYWFGWVVGLPRNTLGYLGISEDSMAVRLLQVLYWLIAIIVGVKYPICEDKCLRR